MNIERYITEYSNELERKGFRPKSILNYTSSIKAFLYHFKDKANKPTEINESNIKEYLRSFKTHNTQRAVHSSIKCFYKYVCRQPNKFRYIEYCKRNRNLPIVLSVKEVQKIIFACSNLKHKAILCLMYSTGVRVGEVINLKICDIDNSRMVINIRDAKGGKDRQVTLDPTLLELLRAYYKEYKPKEYLFNGQNDAPQYSERSIAQFLQKYTSISGVKKRVYPHLIRHCCATHLLESGTDMSILQRLLGHSTIKTTQIYGHISHNLISRITTPLQFIIGANSENLLLKQA